ncbi:MAG: transcription antitermination factor NusB [Burkholderiales bacterium]|jgi:N utilization substance protein B|nr:transcription antitermination factor NusB [Burkholderiales bacterium]
MSKKSPRHLSRSLAVQALYNYRINAMPVIDLEKVLNDFEHDLYEHANYELMHSLIEKSISQFDEMLNYYQPYLQREINAINMIEQIILVIAAIELTSNLSVPAPVIINEAIELSKLYGGPESHKFINNLVDKLAKQLRSNEVRH